MTLSVVLLVLLVAFFVVGYFVDRKNRATPMTPAQAAEHQEWSTAIR